MPPIPFHQLGDEPLYCEAVHSKDDDGFYSGSEDDHYEAPLHRRLQIEKKAMEFLSGSVPFLLSAALRGPFDRKQWNNPWRSTRAESQEETFKAPPARPGRTATTPEVDLPNTQGTSLYPLPSPEITNPPSARKNPYMEAQDYSRIKKWRAAVKSTSTSTDPFWQSQHDKNTHNPPTRKRSADPTWMRKRDRKKRRSINPGNSAPDDSPSRVAAQTKRDQTRQQRASQKVAQLLRDSSPPEDELATNGLKTSPCSNVIVADKSSGMTSLLRPGLTTPRKSARLRQAGDTSEDELSMPGTTPASNGVRSSTMALAVLTGDRSPSRRKKSTRSKSRAPNGRESSLIGKPKNSHFSHSSASQRSRLSEAKTNRRTMAQMAEAALERIDSSPGGLFKQPGPPQDQFGPEDTASLKPMALPHALAGLRSTQQDNSFLFHKRPRSPPSKTESGPLDDIPTNAAALGPSPLQLCATTTNEQGDNFALKEGPVVPGSTAMVQDVACVPVEEPRDPIYSTALDETSPSGRNLTNLQAQLTDDNTGGEIKADNELTAEVEPGAVDSVAETVRLQSSKKHETLEEPRTLLQMDGCSELNSEWITYIDTQLDHTPGFPSEECAMTKKPGTPVVEYGVDGLSDPEWSTIIDSQDTKPLIPGLKSAADPEETVMNVPSPGPGVQICHEQTAHVNPEDLPRASPEEVVKGNEIARSASVSVSSPEPGNQIRQAPEDIIPAKFSQDPKPFQASVGSIIDAYAEISILSAEFDPATAGMPEAKLRETRDEAAVPTPPFALPNQVVAGPVNESDVHNDSIAIGKPQQTQASKQDPVANESHSGHAWSSVPDEVVTCAKIRDMAGSLHPTSQTATEAEVASFTGGCGVLDEPTTSPVVAQLQSPWKGEVAMSLQIPPQAVSNDTSPAFRLSGLDEAGASVESPWNQEANFASHLFVPPATCTNFVGSTADLGILAGKALTVSQPPQSPWAPQTLAAPTPPATDFEMTMRPFSDFKSPSPVNKRASSNGGTLRCSRAIPSILFKTNGQQKPPRRVHFASLPGEQESSITESAPDEMDAIYDEEDVSYFDLSGQKTGTIRIPKQAVRAVSPPPLEMISVEVGALLNHDQKFAKHFAAMSKRGKAKRNPLRLLPFGSQQTPSASQEVGAMAEAFIQASQTRKKDLGLAAEKSVEVECGREYEGTAPIPGAIEICDDQENVGPVDDVSAVLDNLETFFDDTWGVELDNSDQALEDKQSQQYKKNATGLNGLRKVEDPLFSLEANVWAD